MPFLSPVYFQTALWPWTVIQFSTHRFLNSDVHLSVCVSVGVYVFVRVCVWSPVYVCVCVCTSLLVSVSVCMCVYVSM